MVQPRVNDIKKKWSKELELLGFNVSAKNILNDDDGCSFSGKVNVVGFLNHYDPDETKFPRVKEVFKQGLFSVEIVDDEANIFPAAMDVRLENTIPDKTDEDKEDVLDLAASVIEGGDLVDKVAEVGDWVLNTARDQARLIHKDIYGGN
jgi:hypothetical protein